MEGFSYDVGAVAVHSSLWVLRAECVLSQDQSTVITSAICSLWLEVWGIHVQYKMAMSFISVTESPLSLNHSTVLNDAALHYSPRYIYFHDFPRAFNQ